MSQSLIIRSALYRNAELHLAACALYFSVCDALACSSGSVCSSLAIITLRTCTASPFIRCPPSKPLFIMLFSSTITSAALFSRHRSMMLK